jgi:uncharacterized protein (TIGR03083 family)
VEIDRQIDVLTEQARLMAAAARAAGPDAAVPSCPGWVVRDLVRHQGGVHRWAAGIVGAPRTEPWNVELDEVVGSWPADRDLPGWLAEGAGTLAEILSNADPDVQCWSFLPAPSPLAMWARRQAHETAVHRVDAELAAGLPASPVAAEFAEDGIDELLSGFTTRANTVRSDRNLRLHVRCADTQRSWLVRIGPDGSQTTSGSEPGEVDTTDALGAPDGAECTVSGIAEDLYLSLWNRRSPDMLTTGGDRSVLRLFSERMQIRWS